MQCPSTRLITNQRDCRAGDFHTCSALIGGLAMKTKLLFLVALTTCAAILVSAAPVHAVSFNFSFTNQFPLGDVNGTVTGRIDGLADTGASAATAVLITSSLLALGYPLSASDNILSQPSLTIVSNSFTVTSGVLTAMDFRAQFPIANAIPRSEERRVGKECRSRW